MIPKNRTVAPWLRSSMMYEQGLENSGYYRKRKPNTMYKVWLIVIVAAVLAIIMTEHHEEEMTAQVDRKAVMKWTSVPDNYNLEKELWILREWKNADRAYAQIQEASK
jgi:hypothetical protein